MSSDTGNTQAKKEHRGSDNPNEKLQNQRIAQSQPFERPRPHRA